MSAIRIDGEYTIYQLQHLDSANRWCDSNPDYFGTPAGFSASGDCWQKIGQYGTFDRQVALSALAWISGKHPTRSFQIVKRELMQRTLGYPDLSVFKDF